MYLWDVFVSFTKSRFYLGIPKVSRIAGSTAFSHKVKRSTLTIYMGTLFSLTFLYYFTVTIINLVAMTLIDYSLLFLRYNIAS